MATPKPASSARTTTHHTTPVYPMSVRGRLRTPSPVLPTTHCYLTLLPDELLVNVLSFLHINDLTEIRKVSAPS